MSHIPDGPSTARPPQQTDLKALIHARRAELIKVLVELKADTRIEAAESRERLKAKLSELAHVVKWGVADDWASVGEPVTKKLQRWLAESAHQVPPEPATTAARASSPAPANTPAPAKAGQP
ncbi:MAG TPA: hypothetical protein VHW23_32030 [Kofleriaceae bacterium]|jgi:hypothetical protein|nr:hypothetical protein [Kofleriaceae bacterium]